MIDGGHEVDAVSVLRGEFQGVEDVIAAAEGYGSLGAGGFDGEVV
jgi:hypothetical protein